MNRLMNRLRMNRSRVAKRPPTESTSALSSSDTSDREKSADISTNDSPILRLPKELLSAIIDYVPKTQWPSLELVNRSFRDAVYSSWQSMKEFDIGKDVLGIRQSVKGIRLSDISPSILAKLFLRSSLLQSISGFPKTYYNSDEARARYRFDILQIMRQFTNLKRIDFGACDINSVELVEFSTSSASRDRLTEITSSADYKITNHNWPDIFAAPWRRYSGHGTGYSKNSVFQAPRLKLENLYLKIAPYQNELDLLNPRIFDLIDPSSLTVLVLDSIPAPSDYLLSLITKCRKLRQLQFSFMLRCPCKIRPCVHSTSNELLLEAIPEMESLNSLKIGMINQIASSDLDNLDIKPDLPIFINRLGRRDRLILFDLHSYYCSDEVIVGIGQHLTGLKSLELFTQSMTQSTIFVNMIKKMVSLEKLAISGFSIRMTPEVLTAVATHLHNLRSFHLVWASDMDLHVLTSMEHLEELFIGGGTYHEINREFATAFGHQLHTLELRDCDLEFVALFLKQVPGLRRLVFSGYWPHSNRILRMIPMACPRLRELHLLPAVGFCEDNIKVGVQAIIDGCLGLENIRC